MGEEAEAAGGGKRRCCWRLRRRRKAEGGVKWRRRRAVLRRCYFDAAEVRVGEGGGWAGCGGGDRAADAENAVFVFKALTSARGPLQQVRVRYHFDPPARRRM